eukprot:TRINITY_DN6350_c0_g1_i1.p1 TRINITY_DN6350_c0_g1~~TRINITY_DN6350_c0_g1_i1.p1  ORF type:complete len:471 (+),score=91.45 TRINITY_DN6350_c0_g1_i1:101-1513(+)
MGVSAEMLMLQILFAKENASVAVLISKQLQYQDQLYNKLSDDLTSVLQCLENTQQTLKNLSGIHEESLAITEHNEIDIDALEEDNLVLGRGGDSKRNVLASGKVKTEAHEQGESEEISALDQKFETETEDRKVKFTLEDEPVPLPSDILVKQEDLEEADNDIDNDIYQQALDFHNLINYEDPYYDLDHNEEFDDLSRVRKKGKKKTKKDIKPFSCIICGKQFRHNVTLKNHMRRHNEEKTFSCEKCGETFKKKAKLNAHMSLVHEEIQYSCEICGKSYQNNKGLRKHMNAEHGEKKEFPCEKCGKVFKQKTGRDRHMLLHEDYRPFTCDKCGKSFPCKSTLKNHLTIHEERKPVTCDVCGKSFVNKYKLDSHMNVHSKPFSCKVCSKVFSYKISLTNHMLMHEDNRPFSCETCGKSFTQLRILQDHMNIHKGIKPYSCNICGKEFTQSSTLGRHKQSHRAGQNVDEKPFS